MSFFKKAKRFIANHREAIKTVITTSIVILTVVALSLFIASFSLGAISLLVMAAGCGITTWGFTLAIAGYEALDKTLPRPKPSHFIQRPSITQIKTANNNFRESLVSYIKTYIVLADQAIIERIFNYRKHQTYLNEMTNRLGVPNTLAENIIDFNENRPLNGRDLINRGNIEELHQYITQLHRYYEGLHTKIDEKINQVMEAIETIEPSYRANTAHQRVHAPIPSQPAVTLDTPRPPPPPYDFVGPG